MKLSKYQKPSELNELKNKFVSISSRINKEVPMLIDKMTQEQRTSLDNCLAIAAVLQSDIRNVDETRLKSSLKEFVKNASSVFQGDIFETENRQKMIETQKDHSKLVEPRSIGNGKDMYSMNPETFTGEGKTASPYDPSRIAEKILHDVIARFYPSVQDAYDGYCSEGNAAWPYASAGQKCRLGKMLYAQGFNVDYSKWEKQAKADMAEMEKKNKEQSDWVHDNYENRDKKPTSAELAESLKFTSQVDRSYEKTSGNNYCSKCKKTTLWKDNKCTSCGVSPANTPPPSEKKSSILDVYLKAQMSSDQRSQLGQDNVPGFNGQNTLEMTKQGGHDYSCQACNTQQKFDKQGEYTCAKCGGMMKYNNTNGQTASPGMQPNMNQMTPNTSYNAGTPVMPVSSSYGTQVLGMIEAAADRNLLLSYDTVKELGLPYADHMRKAGLKSVYAKYLLKNVLNVKN